MRYSTSFIAAIVISFFLFLGMSFLISNQDTYHSSDFEITSFDMIDEMDSPLKVKTVKPKIPEKEKVKQPPAAPKVEISNRTDRSSISIPTGKADLKNMDIIGFDIPVFPNTKFSTDIPTGDGELTIIAGIQPIYPPEAARTGIEGWVKVEISVNEHGLVSHVEVLDSHPRRIFDQATKRAMYKSKFKPLVIDGKPMAQIAVQIIEFKMDNE